MNTAEHIPFDVSVVNEVPGATPEARAEFGSLANRCAVVTGASTGIGRAIALELARAGAHVIVHYNRSENAAVDVVEQIFSQGGTAELQQADFGNPDQLQAFAARVWSARPVDVWVNNAGVDLLTTPEAKADFGTKLQRLFEIDLRSTLLLGHQMGQLMKQRGSGSIINIGWDQADRGMEGDSGELFAATKNAIMGFTRSLAVSLAPQVRVNCIAPGWIQTAWGEHASPIWQERVMRETPLKRWGTPEDIAAAARFLASNAASFMTGQILCVNGGVVR